MVGLGVDAPWPVRRRNVRRNPPERGGHSERECHPGRGCKSGRDLRAAQLALEPNAEEDESWYEWRIWTLILATGFDVITRGIQWLY